MPPPFRGGISHECIVTPFHLLLALEPNSITYAAKETKLVGFEYRIEMFICCMSMVLHIMHFTDIDIQQLGDVLDNKLFVFLRILRTFP